MMTYILDNNIFSNAFKNYNFSVWDEFWMSWERLIIEKRVISVAEVFHEMKNYFEKDGDPIWDWVLRHKNCFLPPTNQECEIVKEIFQYPKFRESVKRKSIYAGTPEADAFIVAKAKAVDGIIVTIESSKPNSAKIPYIASEFGVPYMTRDEFFRVVRNVERGRNELKGVTIYYNLNEPTVHE